MRGATLALLLLVSVFAVTAAPASAATTTNISLEPSSQSVAAGSSVTYQVVMDSTDGGVGGYEINVSVSDTSVATITDASVEVDPDSRVEDGSETTRTEFADDNSSVRIGTFAGDTVDDGQDVVIATVTVTGQSAGSADVDLDVSSVSDEDGDSYQFDSVGDATVDVTGPGRTLSLAPSDQPVSVGGTATYDVVVSDVDNGVGAYDFAVSTSDTSVAEITAISDRTGAGSVDTSVASDGSSASITASFADTTGSTTDLVIARVTVRGTGTGTADLSIGGAPEVADADGTTYSFDRVSGATVTGQVAPDVNGDGRPATDPDGDSRYEDLNGDGEFTVADVQLLFAVFTSDDRSVLTDNSDLFNFNEEGDVTIGDVQALFGEFTSG